MDGVVDFGRGAISALFVACAVPRGALLGVGAGSGEVGEIEGLASEVGEGEINREAVFGEV